MEFIDLVEHTDLPVRVTLRQLGIPSSTFYGWYKRYLGGIGATNAPFWSGKVKL
jgi:hypothetical protein